MTSPAPQNEKGPIKFGDFEVTDQVFLTTPLTFALVNLMPLLPGHVLVCPRTRHTRLTDLSPAEVTDLFLSVQRVQRLLARHYFSPPSPPNERRPHPKPEHGSFSIAIQDGVDAGQTVPHVHVHVIPRIQGWTAKPGTPGAGGGDELYERMAGEEGNVGGWLWDQQRMEEGKERPKPGGRFPPIEDKDRKRRGREDMKAEAEGYRRVLEEMIREEREEEEEEGKGGDGKGADGKKGDVGSPEWWGKIWPKGGPEDAGPGH